MLLNPLTLSITIESNDYYFLPLMISDFDGSLLICHSFIPLQALDSSLHSQATKAAGRLDIKMRSPFTNLKAP